nr:clathrin interactor EPSIN 1-like [Tanacetum cinerariifolium]
MRSRFNIDRKIRDVTRVIVDQSKPTTLGEAFFLARIAEAMFEENVKYRFGPSKYEDPQGALSKLLQLGLKLNLQHELLVSRPTTLGDAFSLACITESRFEAIEEKEQNIKEEADTTLSLPSEEASPMVKGPLDARPVDEVSSVIKDIFNIEESNMEGMQVRDKFAEFFEDKRSVEKVLSATKLPKGGNSHSTYSPYHLEENVNFEGVGNVTSLAAEFERRKRVKCYVQDLFAALEPEVKPAKSNIRLVDQFVAVPMKNLENSDFFGSFSSHTGSTSSTEPTTQSLMDSGNNSNNQINKASVASSKKVGFQLKFGVWADSLRRGLIDIKISGRKFFFLSH